MWALVILFLVTPDTSKGGVAISYYETKAQCEKEMAPPEDVSELSRAFNGEGSFSNDGNTLEIKQFCTPAEGVIIDNSKAQYAPRR